MDFTPEVEYEFIRKAVSHRLGRTLVNPSNNFLRGSTQTKNPNPTLQIGDYLRYTNEGQSEMVEMLDINTNDNDRKK